jgi:hypothetical protein
MISLEPLADGSPADRNFQALARLVLDTGGVTASVRWGIAAATFTASRVSADKTVTHGLGRTPIAVFVTGATDQAAHVVAFHAHSYTSTTFKARGDFTDGTAPTGNSNFAWVVIG